MSKRADDSYWANNPDNLAYLRQATLKAAMNKSKRKQPRGFGYTARLFIWGVIVALVTSVLGVAYLAVLWLQARGS